MKKKNLVKVFVLSLCLTTVFSTFAFAKDNKQYKYARVSKCAIDTLPVDVQFPD